MLRARAPVLHGILNGVDYSHWNPETDPYLAAHYSADDLSGKRLCKQDLLKQFGLPAAAMDRPLLGVVSRLTSQKGTELILEIAAELAADDLYLVVLGSGDADYEAGLREAAAAYPEHIAVRIGYDEALAHKIEAGADMFLMPSQYEPSGLNQMYSLRYGTVPVVRATGGLDDTIEEGTGFKFRRVLGCGLASGYSRCRHRVPRPDGLESHDAARHAKGLFLAGFGGSEYAASVPAAAGWRQDRCILWPKTDPIQVGD